LKSLLDKFRPKPDWQSPDAAVRAEAVLRLPASEHETVLALAHGDEDARVRRAAVKKIQDAAVLAELARGDADEGVREEAALRLVAAAVHAHDASAGEAAVAGLRDARHLAQVAKTASRPDVRQLAASRIEDPRALAGVVREAEDAAVRLAALARIHDGPTLAALAQKSESKTVALAAVERVQDRAELETIAARAKVGAAARRARARLLAEAPSAPSPAPPPTFADDEGRAAYERARAEQEREAAERTAAVAARDAISTALAAAEGSAVPAAIEEARAAWSVLAPFSAPEAPTLERQFQEELLAAERRLAAFRDLAAKRAKLDEICAKAEALAESPDLAAARAAWTALAGEWEAAGGPTDVAALGERYRSAADRLAAREAGERGARDRKDRQEHERLETLRRRALDLARDENAALRDVDRVLHELREALEHPGPVRRDHGGLLHRLETARKELYPRWQQLREDSEWKRWANEDVQEDLCVKAEALLGLEDMEKAAQEVRDLDARWKQAREAPREKSEALWNRFKAARDAIKAKVDAFYAKQAEEMAANQRRKESLCERAEALADSTDWLKTADELKALQEEWKKIGPTPRAQAHAVWQRFRKPCDRFFTRWHEHRDQRQQEWAKNLEKKEALCAQVEALKDSAEWETTAAELRRLQAEWRTVGAVKKSRSEAVWQRFRTACDHFFDRYKNRDELARAAALARYEAACVEMEGLAPSEEGAAAPEDLAARVEAAHASWRQAGEAPRDAVAPLLTRFNAARDRLVVLWPKSFEGSDLDPEANRRKMEKLCARVEAVLQQVAPAREASAVTDLATRLKDALATNTMGGRAAVEARWHEATTEVESAQAAWQRLGHVPGDAARELSERFERACRRFFDERPRLERPKTPEPPRRPRPRA
jgi:Domain of Unknown Function (DUF349)